MILLTNKFRYTLHADPEYYVNSGRSVQSDIYQIGLTMYRLCNGVGILKQQLSELGITSRPELREQVLAGAFPKRTFFLPHIPKKLAKIVLKALKVNPDERYQNTIEMMNDLSVIDENLDWIFTGNLSNPYTKSDDTYKYDIFVNDKKDITCYRQRHDNGNKTKIGKYCIKYEEGKNIENQLSQIVGGLN